ncbi:HAMP domain-containing histidine kinase [bacterium]|nr:HAMP domain-containing histidine kinase [bacterium]
MNFLPALITKDNDFLKEIFFNVSKYSNNEIIVTDNKLNILFQNSKFKFSDNKFNILDLMPNCSNENLCINFENFINSAKKHIFFKLVFSDELNNFSNIPLDVHICKMYKGNKKLNGYCIIIQDITQEVKNKIQKETFMDILMHDLKNPIRANIQIIELILKHKFGIVGNSLFPIIEELLNSCRLINYMADNLIWKYKNEFSMYELQKQYCNITELIRGKCQNLSPFLERKNQTIELAIVGTIPPVNIDEEEIGKVINNLIVNASEQSKDNSIIRIEIIKNSKKIVVTFKNNGYSQTESSLKQIFEEYITCANKFRKVGFGLELYNCKRIIEAHRGHIYAKNSDNQGTMVIFSLPV